MPSHRYENKTLKEWKQNPSPIEDRTEYLSKNYNFTDCFHILRLNLLENLPVCKQCGIETHYRGTNKFLSFCSKSCAGRWGNNTEKQKEKMKRTWREKYGVDHPFQSKTIRYKIEQTNLERYGVKHPLQSSIIQNKLKQTNLERYGVEHSLQSKDVQEKAKITNLERYGAANARQSENIKSQIEQTNFFRYGGKSPFSSALVRDKSKTSINERYGVENIGQKHLQHSLFFLNDLKWWEQFNSIFEVKTQIGHLLSIKGFYNYINKFRPDLIGVGSISTPHQRVIDLLNQHNIFFKINDRKIIPPLELDIYIPSKNLAIEVNGVYWHSELQGKDKNYHLNKTIECEKQNVQLLHLWDYEVEQKWDLVSSMILSRCGVFENRIGARKCSLSVVDSKTEKDFLNQNHLQGYRPSTICYGLYFQDDLLSLMSFGKSRFNKKIDWELLRFCNKINIKVMGGASKLFNQRPLGSVISYSDRRYSEENLYIQLGLNNINTSDPSYYYTNDYQTFFNRVKFQKHKLSELLESYDPSETEWENMKKNGYDRIWDCGTKTYLIQ